MRPEPTRETPAFQERVTAVVSHEEETHLCQGPSGSGRCPYGLKAKIRTKRGLMWSSDQF